MKTFSIGFQSFDRQLMRLVSRVTKIEADTEEEAKQKLRDSERINGIVTCREVNK